MEKTLLLQDEHWYRNPWVWLVITIPAATIIGCLITVYIAISNPDYLVHDEVDEIHSAAPGQP